MATDSPEVLERFEALKQHARKAASDAYFKLNHSVPYDELVQDALIGAYDAARRFDPTRGHTLTTFAYPRMNGEIMDGLRGRDYLSRHFRKKAKKAYDAGEHSPYVSLSLDEVLSDDGYSTMADFLLHSGDEEARDREANAEIIHTLVQRLDDRTRYIFIQYFWGELPYSAIGEDLGISESRVCQIVGKTCETLQRWFLQETHETPRAKSRPKVA